MSTGILPGITIAILLIFALACKNQERDNKAAFDDRNVEGEMRHKEPVSVFYLLPSPAEILERFENTGLPYKPELLNSPGDRSKYLTFRSKALNLGIYITDMAYSALHERTNEAIDYLEAVKVLNTEVNISTGIFENLYERAQRASGNKDSIIALTSEVFHEITIFLEEGGSLNTIALISAGAFIESMYIVLESVGEYKESHPAIEHLEELRFPLVNLLEQSRFSEQDPNVKSIIELLEQINDIFQELSREKQKIDIRKTGTGELMLLGGETVSISEREFLLLREKVREIRQNIISN